MLHAASERLLQQRSDLRRLRLDETIAEGTFAGAKKRGADVGLTKKSKGTKIMLLADSEGIPLAVDIASANRTEVTLTEPILEQRVLKSAAEHLLYGNAAYSDPLRQRLPPE